MVRERERAIKNLYRMGNWVVRIVGSAIFVYLTWHAFRYTQYIMPHGKEIPEKALDSLSRNILGLAVALGITAVLTMLERGVNKKLQHIVRRGVMALTLVWIAAASIWWTFSSAHLPYGDPAFIYGGAAYFIEGQYGFLGESGYCGMYPYQLGLTALCELLFRMAGACNYRLFEIICIVLAVGSVYLGYRILREITESTAIAISYHMLMAGCLPLILYTPWVYGDIPSIFFALLAEWMLLRYQSRKKTRYLAILAFSLALAMLVRKNSMILMIAVGLAILFHTFLHRDRKIVLAFLLGAALSYGSYAGIYKMYEIRSGYEHSKGIPVVTWITMGMMEDYGVYGWYNDYPKEVYSGTGFDRELTEQIARRDLMDRLEVFRKDREYARLFFREKITSQWNQPLYEALYFNLDSPKRGGHPSPDSLAAKLGGAYYLDVLAICDRWQFIVYAGMLCYFLFAVKKDSNILQHVLAITIIGGFFFSIIHEAKARYIFPYYVMMFPFAAYGYRQAVLLAGSGLSRIWKRTGSV